MVLYCTVYCTLVFKNDIVAAFNFMNAFTGSTLPFIGGALNMGAKCNCEVPTVPGVLYSVNILSILIKVHFSII